MVGHVGCTATVHTVNSTHIVSQRLLECLVWALVLLTMSHIASTDREKTVIASGFPDTVTLDEVKDIFKGYDVLLDTVLLPGMKAILQFDKVETAKNVVNKLNGETYQGDTLSVNIVEEGEWWFTQTILEQNRALSQAKGNHTDAVLDDNAKQPDAVLDVKSKQPDTDAQKRTSGKGPKVVHWSMQDRDQEESESYASAYQGYVPRLPIFSGGEVKVGEVSFQLWRSQVIGLMRNRSYPDHILLQAISRSVRGVAADVLLHLGDNVSLVQVVEKYDVVFGNVLSPETLIEQFCTAKQKGGESVSLWSCRLEDLKMKIVGGPFTEEVLYEMLRTKFWTGLRDEYLRNATRHHFDSHLCYDELLVRVRAAEIEKSEVHVSVVQASSSMEQKLDSLLTRMDRMEGRLKRMEVHEPSAAADVKPQASTNYKFKGKCSFCDRVGHKMERCFALKKLKEQQQGKQTAESTLKTNPKN